MSNGAGEANEGRLTQAERTALSDRRMFEAAIDLINERGTQKTTLKEIGEEFEPDWDFVVGSIGRGDETIIPRRDHRQRPR